MSSTAPPVAVTGGSGSGIPVFSYGSPPTRAEKYERLAFTFCRMGTIGLIAWLLTPPVFVLVVAVIAIGLYVRSISLGATWTKCLLRKPSLVVAFWAAIAAADAYWLLVLGARPLI
jgi:hypothetical protein